MLMEMQSGRGHAVVIGASIAGLATARVLAERFARVTILERHVQPSGAASIAPPTRLLRPSLIARVLRAQRQWRRVEASRLGDGRALPGPLAASGG
jgi:glycine/D-amino acid oxidase-like deaminating enzyme